MKPIRIIALMLALVMLTAAAYGWGDNPGDSYKAALELMAQSKYSEAAEAFYALGGYENAPQLAMYCAAIAAAEEGNYPVAISNLDSLGSFKDSGLLITYYTARYYEDNLDYEKAAEVLESISLYRDSSARIASYPDKILARDYALAAGLESAGKLESALKAFKALIPYSDSADRAAAIQAKLDEQKAAEEARLAEQKAKEAEEQAARDAAAREKTYNDAIKAENNGDYLAAYNGFSSLGTYLDSAERAAAIKNPADYARAINDFNSGSFASSYKLFSALAELDYEDSADKAYVLSVSTVADMKALGSGLAVAKYNGVYGLVNLNENLTTAPRWNSIGSFDSSGMAKVELDDNYGYINTLGEVVVECKWSSISGFDSNDLAKVELDGKYGYVDRNGKTIISCTWAEISDFRDGLCTVASLDSSGNYLFGIMDTEGNTITSAQWRALGDSYNSKWNPSKYSSNTANIYEPTFINRVILIQNKEGKYALLDNKGKVLGEYWDSINGFYENLLIVSKGSKYGYIDGTGSIIITPQYQDARGFSEGYAAVKINGYWTFIDKENNRLITGKNTAVTDFNGGMAGVYVEGTGWQIIDKTGMQKYFKQSNYMKHYNEAIALINDGKYTEAMTVLENIEEFRNSSELIAACEEALLEGKYAAAAELQEKGEYESAIESFKAIIDYKDSAERIIACEETILEGKYTAAVDMQENSEYEQAIAYFTAIIDYKDSAERIAVCEGYIYSERYETAIALMTEEKYEEAIAIFEKLNGYKDSEEQIDAYYTGLWGEEVYNTIKAVDVGSMITFGTYEQNNKKSDGKENIEWLVLAKDGSKVLVISKYALDCQPYNTKDKDVTWETCSLRSWLNKDFLSKAFSSKEQKSIVTTTVTADKNPNYSTSPGKDTQDKVFLLSVAEAGKYFSTDEARRCAATDYAKAQGASTSNSNKTASGAAACWWWMRSPGCSSDFAALVFSSGLLSYGGDRVNRGNFAVRPALWIDLAS